MPGSGFRTKGVGAWKTESQVWLGMWGSFGLNPELYLKALGPFQRDPKPQLPKPKPYRRKPPIVPGGSGQPTKGP